MGGMVEQRDVARIIATLADFSAKLDMQKKSLSQHRDEAKPREERPALALARSLIRSRAAAQAVFPADLFQDPAFDILLTVFVSDEEGHDMPISAAVTSGGTPMTTGLRWLSKLEKLGMICRRGDDFDKRKQYISLTEETRALVLEWLTPLPFLENR